MPRQLVSHAAKPINKLVDKMGIKCPTKKSLTRATFCVVVVFSGAFMATHAPETLPHSFHFAWDGVAYTIHGIGAAPVAERIIAYLAGLLGE